MRKSDVYNIIGILVAEGETKLARALSATKIERGGAMNKPSAKDTALAIDFQRMLKIGKMLNSVKQRATEIQTLITHRKKYMYMEPDVIKELEEEAQSLEIKMKRIESILEKAWEK